MLHLGQRPSRSAGPQLGILLGALLVIACLSVGLSSSSAAASTGALSRRGDRSTAVVAAQRALVAAGIPLRGGADGVFGPATQAAVAEYQRRRGLPTTSEVDTPTATLLGLLPPTPLLAQGAKGDAVVQLQQRLLAQGLPLRGGADGRFGPATASALKTFQAAKGIAPTGALDAGTDAVLQAAVAPRAATPTLAQGSRGPAVIELQRLLAAAGFGPKGGADGLFGSRTTQMVKAFQAKAGLPVTGMVDDATRAALGAATAPAPTITPTTAVPVTTPAAPPADVPPAPPAAAGSNSDPSGVHLDYFPLAHTCRLHSSFGAARSGGFVHVGMDIMAARGTPVYAVATGVIHRAKADYPGSVAGNSVWLTTAADGTFFFYAHLDRYAPGITAGITVKGGTLLGYVGSTGTTGTPHLHLEVHPQGGAAIDPYPLVKAASGC